jgi:hypothetical protein
MFLIAYVKIDSNSMLSFDRPSLIFRKFQKSYTLESIYEKYDFPELTTIIIGIFKSPLPSITCSYFMRIS